MYQAKALVKKLARALDFHKGEDVLIIDVSKKTPFARFYILVSASNSRKLNSVVGVVEDEIAKVKDASIRRIEKGDSPWIVIDCYDIVVHVMASKTREKYALESLYKDCPIIEYQKGE